LLSPNLYLLMQFYVTGRFLKLKLALNIIIGTVPLQETVRSLPAAQFQPGASHPPSAPPPDRPDVGNFSLRKFIFKL